MAIFSVAGPAVARAETTSTSPPDPATATLPAPALAVALALVSTDGVDGPTVLGVTVSSLSGVLIDGTVSVSRGSAVLSGCDLIPLMGPVASVTARCTTRLPVGTSRLRASFVASDDDTPAAATSAVESLTIAPAATVIRLSLPTEPRVGARVTYRASVGPADAHPARLPIHGTVTFADDGHTISGCGAVRLTHLHAGCRTRYAADGRQTITSRYSGDHDFAGASSNLHIVDVRYPRAVGRITARMRWTFHYTTHYTEVQALRILHVARGSTVALSCHGVHCPFASIDRIAHHGGALDIDGRLHGRRLSPGDTVQVAVQRLRYAGKYYRFRIRRGRAPSVLISCLAQGSDRPGVGCGRR